MLRLRLSIIIPFYNVEQYIAQCLDSVYQQDIPEEEYEVICVNDCSPDNSREIVKEYQKKHTNLILIEHERNKKLGGARNTGLRAAKGEYVWYVDSDDELCPNVFSTLLMTVEKNQLDILQFDYSRGVNGSAMSKIETDIVKQGEIYLFEDNRNDWYNKISGAWRQLFRREYLLKKRLEFIEDAMFEDTDYLLNAFLEADRVQYLSLLAYNYQVNEESVTIAPITPIKLAWRVNLVARCSQYVETSKTDIAKDKISKMISNTLSSLRNEVKNLKGKQKSEYLHSLTTEIRLLKSFVNWRTWLALRYGITWFV